MKNFYLYPYKYAREIKLLDYLLFYRLDVKNYTIQRFYRHKKK